ncbi:protein Shroom2, partial [Nephila pilipes]
IDVHSSGQRELLSSASSPQLSQSYSLSPNSPSSSYCGETDCPASPDLPLPPPPSAEGNEIMNVYDEPLPPPPDPRDVDVQPRMLDSSSL